MITKNDIQEMLDALDDAELLDESVIGTFVTDIMYKFHENVVNTNCFRCNKQIVVNGVTYLKHAQISLTTEHEGIVLCEECLREAKKNMKPMYVLPNIQKTRSANR